MSVDFVFDGEPVSVADDQLSLLEALRDVLGVRSVKDGCSPQGQCGCCTVLVDGSPRVACVTPVGRVRGRTVTSPEHVPDAAMWSQAFCDAGASQCGFCSPGIIARLSVLPDDALAQRESVDRALLAHLCRCTGWQTIREAAALVASRRSGAGGPVERPDDAAELSGEPVERPGGRVRDLELAARRSALEGGVAQSVGPDVALGHGGFADDAAPDGALVAVLGPDGSWVVGETVGDARRRAGKVQGRRTTAPPTWPVTPPPGSWHHTLQTTWIEPAYLEPDATWCEPGGEPHSPLGNGGAFGGKAATEVVEVARRLAVEHGRPVRVLMSREDTVRRGPKRPPIGLGLAIDGSGVVRVARPVDRGEETVIADRVRSVAPDVAVEFVDVDGPPVSAALRGAVWAEVAAARSAIGAGPDRVVASNGAVATASIDDAGRVSVAVECGAVLDAVILRSYVVGAAHMALSMAQSEAVAVDDDGVPLDLTIRSFGVLRAVDTPPIDVELRDGDGEPINGSDAVFAAVLAAAWRRLGHPLQLPA